MSEEQWIRLGILGILFVLSAFFSGSETAFMALDRLRLKHLAEKDRRGAKSLEILLEQPDRLLGTILVGNNLVNIAATVVATGFFVQLYGEQGEYLTVLLLTPFLLIFSEVCPKTYAAGFAERIAFLALPPIRFVMRVLAPVVWVVILISRFINRLLGGGATPASISLDEIRTAISVGQRAGLVAKEKHRMLLRVFELSETCVRDVMIPRTEIIGLEVGTSFEQAMELARAASCSRFPVFEGSLDRIIGIIHSKDILRFVDSPEKFSLREAARLPYYVPESMPIESLLHSLRRRRVHLAVVVDEYGGVEGIITLEDVLEEIVGEIQDEYDIDEILFRELGPGRWLVDGSASLRQVNRRLGLALAEEEVNTLAGYLLSRIGSIPEEGQVCEVQGVHFTVRKVRRRRIEEVELSLPHPSPP